MKQKIKSIIVIMLIAVLTIDVSTLRFAPLPTVIIFVTSRK